jgi:hypothetical protein
VTDSAPAGHLAAATYLRELLLRPGAYRRLWEQHVVRVRRDDINQLAVAEVLARHLWNHPRRPADAGARPLQLKDTVSRMLSGRMLSRSTLKLFIDAFGLTDDEADRLRRLWQGSAVIGVLTGPRAVEAATEQDMRTTLGPPRHRTVSMHDHVHVGKDRLLARTRTLQVLEAAYDGVDRIPYLYDTHSLTLEVGQGCQGVSGKMQQVSPEVFATEIILASVLAKGETTTLEYWTTLHREPADPNDVSEREYRRAVIGQMENFDMRVEFHPEALPATVWWARWDGIEGEIIQQEPLSLDSQHSAHRYLRFISKTVAGIYWTWE